MDTLTLNKEGVGGEGCACWSLPGTDLGDGLLTSNESVDMSRGRLDIRVMPPSSPEVT